MCVCLLIALCRRAPQRNGTRSVYIHPPHQTTQTSHSQPSKNKPPGHPRHPRGAAGLPGAAHAGQPSHRPDVLARGAGVPVRVGMDMRGWMDERDGWPAATISTIHTHSHPQSKIITHILNPQSPKKTRKPPGSAPAASLRSSTARASMSSTPGPARRSFRWPRRVG